MLEANDILFSFGRDINVSRLINEYIRIFTFITCRGKNYKFRKEQSTSGLFNIRKKEMRVAVDIFILEPNHIND